jgi:hypothetical protein
MYTGCSELFDYRRPTDKQPILPQTHPALQAAEKVIFPEGYGFQAVRKCFAMNSALDRPWELSLVTGPSRALCF